MNKVPNFYASKSRFLIFVICICLILFLINNTYGQNSDNVLITLGAGYRFPDKENQFDGYNGGIFFDVTTELKVNKHFFVGLNIMDSWSQESGYYAGPNNEIIRRYSFFGVSPQIIYRASTRRLNVHIGIGVGNLHSKITVNNDYTDFNYLNLNIFTGIGYRINSLKLGSAFVFYELLNIKRINRFLLIKAEISYYIKL